jgi:hypothetical protein
MNKKEGHLVVCKNNDGVYGYYVTYGHDRVKLKEAEVLFGVGVFDYAYNLPAKLIELAKTKTVLEGLRNVLINPGMIGWPVIDLTLTFMVYTDRQGADHYYVGVSREAIEEGLEHAHFNMLKSSDGRETTEDEVRSLGVQLLDKGIECVATYQQISYKLLAPGVHC